MLLKFDFKTSQNYQEENTGYGVGVRHPEALSRPGGDSW